MNFFKIKCLPVNVYSRKRVKSEVPIGDHKSVKTRNGVREVPEDIVRSNFIFAET